MHSGSNPTIAFNLMSIGWTSLNSITCSENYSYKSYLANRFELVEKCLQHLPLDFNPFPLGKSAGFPPRNETIKH